MIKEGRKEVAEGRKPKREAPERRKERNQQDRRPRRREYTSGSVR